MAVPLDSPQPSRSRFSIAAHLREKCRFEMTTEALIECLASIEMNSTVASELGRELKAATCDNERIFALMNWAGSAVNEWPENKEDLANWINLKVPSQRVWESVHRENDAGPTVPSLEANDLACEVIDAAAAVEVRVPGLFRPTNPISYFEVRKIADSLIEAAQASAENSTKHSEDFTSVIWFGTPYSFATGRQAQSVKALWEAWENGTPRLNQNTIGDKAGFGGRSFRLIDVFRRHPAWGKMIISVGKGVFRLQKSEENLPTRTSCALRAHPNSNNERDEQHPKFDDAKDACEAPSSPRDLAENRGNGRTDPQP